ncbi:pseudouridine synthase [Mycoplasmopsis hyopharyngis]|uniref:pseudouridine synthase n=1 Tax=Mycoplasmopsis hyopharyngis TaxID=29558 RepID=UPI003873158C
MEKIRIQKVIANAGFCSRRKAEELIVQNRVKVNDQLATLGMLIDATNDKIKIDNKLINTKKEDFVYYLINKPAKTICTANDPLNRKKVTDLIETDKRIFTVGRLDFDTTGVLFLTNDGDFAYKLTHPKFNIIRKYRARINEPLTNEELKAINKKILINGILSEQVVEQIDKKTYLVTLKLGTYHHVKEIFKYVNKKVINLKRIEYAGITVEKMMIGQYRKLTINELKRIKTLIHLNEERIKNEKDN